MDMRFACLLSCSVFVAGWMIAAPLEKKESEACKPDVATISVSPLSKSLFPVGRDEVNCIVMYRLRKNHPNWEAEPEVLTVISESNVVSRLYDSLFLGSSNSPNMELCDYIVYVNWLGSTSNVLFTTGLLNMNAVMTAESGRISWIGQNVAFAAVVRDLMEAELPEMVSERRRVWESIQSETVRDKDSFWGKCARQEVCEAEMTLVREFERNAFVEGSNVVAIKKLVTMADSWDRQHGVVMASASEILSFVGSVSTTLCYMVEVQWATSHRGIVKEIAEDGIVLDIWYVFKYADKWRRLWSRGGFPRN